MRRAAASLAMRSATPAPRLRGVVFDMDGTLTVPNLDFGEMYRRAGVPKGEDILAPRWRDDPTASAVVEEMEEEGRRTLRIMPGAGEFATWLHAHGVPMALVTRNSARTIAHFHEHVWPANLPPMSPAISRDDAHPAKPDPAALAAIAETWGIPLGPGLLMVGDSPANDVCFGKAAGVRTALLDTGRRHAEAGGTQGADVCVENLAALARQLWAFYTVDSPICTPELHTKRSAPVPVTAACVAAAAGDVTALRGQLRADLSAACPESGNTPLIFAADACHLEAVEALLAEKVPLDVRGFLGATAVSRAARRGHLPVLRALLLAGADADIPNDKLQYPMHFAAFKLNPGAVELLLEHGANAFVLDRKGRTPAEDTSDEAIRSTIIAGQSEQVAKRMAAS